MIRVTHLFLTMKVKDNYSQIMYQEIIVNKILVKIAL